MEEEWRVIPGFQQYEASNLGRIRSLMCGGGIDHTETTPRRNGPRLMKGNPNNRKRKVSHLMVTLRKDKQRHHILIHRLILETFVGPCPSGLEGSHLNGCSTDNRIDNLVWESRSENCKRRGSYPKPGLIKLTDAKFAVGCQLYQQGGYTHSDVGRLLGVDGSTFGKRLKRQMESVLV